MNKYDKQSRCLFIVICLIIVFIVSYSYYNFFFKNDYVVTKQISCDPKVDSCFVSDCKSNDSTCDPTATYLKIEVPSKYAGSDYDSLTCAKGSSLCRVITCEDDTLDAGEKCFK